MLYYLGSETSLVLQIFLYFFINLFKTKEVSLEIEIKTGGVVSKNYGENSSGSPKGMDLFFS